MMLGAEDDAAKVEEVSKKLSEITEKKLNCDVAITRVGFGSYDTQLNLALSSGEQLDLFNLFDMNKSVLANNGQIAALDDLLGQYGQGIKGIVSDEDWGCAKVNGSIYAVPTNKDHAGALGFIMRKDILAETGYKLEDIKSFDDLHKVLQKVKELYPDMYPVASDSGKMMTLEGDNLGDINNLGTVMDPYSGTSTKVEDIYESDYYKDLCTMTYQWAQEGLIMPDAATNSEGADTLIGANKAFGRFSGNIITTASGLTEQSQTAQHELVVWTYKDPLSTTDATIGCGWGIGANSVDPERAMALLNLMYTDPEVANLVGNGIEGEQYKIVDEAKGYIDFPDGKNAMNTGYSRMVWAWPNEMITYLWNGELDTKWTDLAAFNKNAIQSSVKGFTFDSSNVANEIAACSNVVNKYNQALLSGSLDPSKGIPDYVSELKDAGIDKIIAEKQKQIDAWSASK
jgi:putative aldouronate transport system substrate-binding protein